jgi:hypothetical protein
LRIPQNGGPRGRRSIASASRSDGEGQLQRRLVGLVSDRLRHTVLAGDKQHRGCPRDAPGKRPGAWQRGHSSERASVRIAIRALHRAAYVRGTPRTWGRPNVRKEGRDRAVRGWPRLDLIEADQEVGANTAAPPRRRWGRTSRGSPVHRWPVPSAPTGGWSDARPHISQSAACSLGRIFRPAGQRRSEPNATSRRLPCVNKGAPATHQGLSVRGRWQR